MEIQTITQLIIFLSFTGLLGFTVIHQFSRHQLYLKSREDWLIDILGLAIQGGLIPLLQATLVYQLYRFFLPNQQGSWQILPILAFIISFVLVDYLYYWNHRLLHTKYFWQLHQVHHTVTQMDVLGTSRNTIWTSLCIVYLWIHTLFLYLLADPRGYLIGVSLTCALDLWRHSSLLIPENHWLYRVLSFWCILPQDHAWHHSREMHHSNYGANWKIWDRIHGTYDQKTDLPAVMGISTALTLMQKLFFPFS